MYRCLVYVWGAFESGAGVGETVLAANKEAMAREAYALIAPGDTVYLDVSSLTLALAHEIARGTKPVRVVSNMPAALEVVAANSLVEAVSTGGEFDEVLGGYLGPATQAALARESLARCFMGAGSITMPGGELTTSSDAESQVKRVVLAQASWACLMAGAEKFGEVDGVVYAALSEFDAVVGCNFTPAQRDWCATQGVTVYAATSRGNLA